MDTFGWSNSETVMTFSIIVFVFAFITLISGRLQDRIGPRIVATIGGILYGLGLILSSTATTTTQLYIYYGVISGIGVGFVYVCPLTACIKCFPDKKGFITGIAVGAFGLGSLVFKTIIEYLLEVTGVSETFFYLGILFMVLIILGAQFLNVPKTISQSVVETKNQSNFTVVEMLKTKTCYLLWAMFGLGTMGGLLVIGLAKDIGVEIAHLDPGVATNSVTMIALFNALGRLGWGSISDRFDRIKVIAIMAFITSGCLVMMSVVSLNFITYFVFLAGIAACFGGTISVFPTVIGEFYGIKNLGANYGVVFQAYGLAALVGPVIVANARSLQATFVFSSIVALMAGILALFVKKPVKQAVLQDCTELEMNESV
ncbi:MAG: OFA family MFS transporter, partial [Eubacteriales bacterium]|nr:OFA family MFS transporter [Eubacteriales bacterium]